MNQAREEHTDPNGSCPFSLMEPFLVDVMPRDALDPYDWTLLRHVSKTLHAMIPSAGPLSEALLVLGTPAALHEYQQHQGEKAVTLFGLFTAFMRRPRTKHDYDNYRTRRICAHNVDFTDFGFSFNPLLEWCLYNLNEPSGFQLLVGDMPLMFTAFVRQNLMRVVCSSTPVFRAQAQRLLTDGEDLGTKRWASELSPHSFMLVEPIVRFNPALRYKLGAYDEPEAAALYIELGGQSDITNLLCSTEPGDHAWLQVYLAQRCADVQKCVDAYRDAHDNDPDTDEPFEATLNPAVREMLEEAGLL